ncbi:MAG: GNAT family N-acetyltransferase [Rhodocyclaceae bacterium]|nr:GNAT family N-acetyltransferase [Rhodocyclaceae bacterium]
MMHDTADLTLRPAGPGDVALLRGWERYPHVPSSPPGCDWCWEVELAAPRAGVEPMIALLAGRPLGFLQILDPAREQTGYWGPVGEGIRAIDIWIGEPADLGRGLGSRMMASALARCFGEAGVCEVWVDPLAGNRRAHRFYARHGFRVLGPRVLDGDACLVMGLSRSDWQAAGRGATLRRR